MQQFSVSAVIAAPAAHVYEIIADYRHGHPEILPKPPFVSLAVEEGGVGAGTRMLVHIRMFGRTIAYRAVVSEPEPGRVLVETNDNGYVTSFTVDPLAGGQQARVTFTTVVSRKSGARARLERWLVERMFRPVYVRELAQLATVAHEAHDQKR